MSDYRAGIDSVRPDWVMLGMPGPTGVLLIASKKLTYAELTVELDRMILYDGLFPAAVPWLRPVRQDISVKVHMRDFVLIEALDYQTAFDELFKTWSPTPDQPKEISTGPRELEQ